MEYMPTAVAVGYLREPDMELPMSGPNFARRIRTLLTAAANRPDVPSRLPARRLAPTLDRLEDLGPLPDDITVHLDAGYDSDKTRALLVERGLHGRTAHKGEKAPIQASRRWHVERTHAWQNTFQRLARCYERRTTVSGPGQLSIPSPASVQRGSAR